MADFPRIHAVLTAALFIAGSPALAQSNNRVIGVICHTHAEIEAKLASDFGEKRFGAGISGDGTLFEFFIAPTGTFTVVKTTPKGMSCIVDFGEDWQTLNHLDVTGLPEDGPAAVPTPF